MTLKIAGNFDLNTTKSLLKKYFGNYKKDGIFKSKHHSYSSNQNYKPYVIYEYGDKNKAFIGYKTRLKSFNNQQVLYFYMQDLSIILKQKLRNKHGSYYSINSDFIKKENAFIYGVTVDGLHKNFQNNRTLINDFMIKDIKNISSKTIKNIKKLHEKSHLASKKDSTSLMTSISLLIFNIAI